MFDKKIVTLTSLVVSEVNLIPNLHTTHRVCGERGEKSMAKKRKKAAKKKSAKRKRH